MKNIIKVGKKYVLKILLCAGVAFGFAYGANADANTNATCVITNVAKFEVCWLDGHKYIIASSKVGTTGGVFVLHAFSCPCLNNSKK